MRSTATARNEIAANLRMLIFVQFADTKYEHDNRKTPINPDSANLLTMFQNI